MPRDDDHDPNHFEGAPDPDRHPRLEPSDAGGDPGGERGVELDPSSLSPEALRGLVEEFVSREGTDYGHRDRTLGEKVEDVLLQLASGEARIVFDLESESASIMPARSLPPARR